MKIIRARDGRRIVRKHRLVIIGWAAFLFILFFPTLFMGRILSPNDVYRNYEPWKAVDSAHAQNPLINDPPTSYYSAIALLKSDWDAFNWNRYIGSGVPGFESVASPAPVLSPFILLAALLPLLLVYSGIVFLKFSASVFFTYAWLREERLGKWRAAVGSLIFAGAGPYIVWWLWQGTNATTLYPAMLWAIARMFRRKHNSTGWLVMLGVSFVMAGYPATVAYGAWVAVLYSIFLAVKKRTVPWRELGRAAASCLLALMIVAPALSPFVRFLERTGYLQSRSAMSLKMRYPASYLRLFVEPYSHGDPAAGNWTLDPSRGFADNFVENTVYVGIATLLLALIGLADRRGRTRWFWSVFLLVLLAAMFGGWGESVIGRLPGVKYSPLFRLRVLLPLAFAYLGACGAGVLADLGARARSIGLRPWLVALAIVLWSAWDLGLFAGHFYGYLEPADAGVPRTPVVDYLASRPQPFRIAPSFNELIPNTAQYEGLEDIRAHWAMEADYRSLLRRIDPSTDQRTNMTLFNSLHTNLSDPLLAMLNVRYVIEPPKIDIVRWRIAELTTPSAAATGTVTIEPGETRTQQVDIDFSPAWSAAFTFSVIGRTQPRAKLELRAIRPETGEVVWKGRRSADELRKEGRIYVPFAGIAQTGDALLVEIEPVGMTVRTRSAGEGASARIVYLRVRSPWIFDRDLPGGRIWENVGRCERYWATWRVVTRPFRQILASDPSFDFRTRTVAPGLDARWRARLARVPPRARSVRIRILEYSGSRQVIRTSARVPFLFTTSEKLTRELVVHVDGREARLVKVNGLFAGIPLRSGEHEVVLERRIGRPFWPLSAVGIVLTLGLGVVERRRRLMER